MIGDFLKYMRKKRELSQQKLGEQIGISRTTLANYEQNTREPTFDTIELIANYLGYKIYFESDEEKLEIKDIKRKDL